MKRKLAVVTAVLALATAWALAADTTLKQLAETEGVVVTTNKHGVITVTVPQPKAAVDTNRVLNLWDYLTTGTNYFAVPFATYSVNDHSFGGGLALGYKLSEVIAPVMRVEYFADSWWNVSLTANLQPPRSLFGKLPVTPFAIAGLGTPFSGGGEDDGKLVSIVGGGLVLHMDWAGDAAFWKKFWLAADYEYWSGMPERQTDQVRFGAGISF